VCSAVRNTGTSQRTGLVIFERASGRLRDRIRMRSATALSVRPLDLLIVGTTHCRAHARKATEFSSCIQIRGAHGKTPVSRETPQVTANGMGGQTRGPSRSGQGSRLHLNLESKRTRFRMKLAGRLTAPVAKL
jgi:hypothetical protein